MLVFYIYIVHFKNTEITNHKTKQNKTKHVLEFFRFNPTLNKT
jgi:hypothetical protein